MLLQILVRLQNGCTQSFRSSLGIIRFSPPLAASTRTCRDCRRLFIEQSLPSKKEYFNQMRLAIKTWTKKNGLPSMPQASISDLCHHLWSEHTQQVTNHITKSSINQLQSTFEGVIFHCEDKHASSLRIYCPCLYYQSIASTFQDLSISEPLPDEPSSIVTSLVE